MMRPINLSHLDREIRQTRLAVGALYNPEVSEVFSIGLSARTTSGLSATSSIASLSPGRTANWPNGSLPEVIRPLALTVRMVTLRLLRRRIAKESRFCTSYRFASSSTGARNDAGCLDRFPASQDQRSRRHYSSLCRRPRRRSCGRSNAMRIRPSDSSRTSIVAPARTPSWRSRSADKMISRCSVIVKRDIPAVPLRPQAFTMSDCSRAKVSSSKPVFCLGLQRRPHSPRITS
jgi:hypothetical protein